MKISYLETKENGAGAGAKLYSRKMYCFLSRLARIFPTWCPCGRVLYLHVSLGVALFHLHWNVQYLYLYLVKDLPTIKLMKNGDWMSPLTAVY